jgi:hypothetical protein
MKYLFASVLFAVGIQNGYGYSAYSGLCDTANAQSQLQSTMNSTAISGTPYELTADCTTYTPGQRITLTLTGTPFRGILVYVADSSNSTKRVGSFVIPANMQNNAAVCTNSETPNSSITHTRQNTDYPGSQTFTYTAPSTAGTGDLLVNFIIVTVAGNTRQDYVGANALRITKSASTSTQTTTSSASNSMSSSTSLSTSISTSVSTSSISIVSTSISTSVSTSSRSVSTSTSASISTSTSVSTTTAVYLSKGSVVTGLEGFRYVVVAAFFIYLF